jgi:pimeloyl-[acyl-carrier protein] methyl ester esterase
LSTGHEGRGRDLVLVHGWGMNGAVWGDLAEGLSERFRLRVLELPGHGHAPYDPAATSLAAWARICLEVAPTAAIWLGWSLGALVALQAALSAPQRVERLVLLGGTPRFVQGPDWPCAMARETLGQFRENLAEDSRATLQRFLGLQVRGTEGAAEALRLLRRRLAATPPPRAQALDTGLDLLEGTDLRERLGELDCPSLWLLGERDTLVPLSLGERLPRYLRRGEVRSIAGAGHAPFLSHPAAVRAAIVDFVG